MSLSPTKPGVHAGHPGPYNLCRESACATHKNRYYKAWKYDVARGQRRTIDAAPIRTHIAALTGAGWSLRAIGAHAGLSPSVISRIARDQRTVRRPVAQAILVLDPATLPRTSAAYTGAPNPEPFVSRVGAVRRIQALLRMGWTHKLMHERSGVVTACVLNQQGRWVTRSTHDALAALYRELSSVPGPSAHTRGRAAALGYASPADWEDIDLDEAPESMAAYTELEGSEEDYPDEAAISRRLDGDKAVALTEAERFEVARRWDSSGRSRNELERVTGLNPQRYLPLLSQAVAS